MADDRFFIPPPPPGTPKIEVPVAPAVDAPRPIVPLGAPVESATHRVPVRPPSPPPAPPAAAPPAERVSAPAPPPTPPPPPAVLAPAPPVPPPAPVTAESTIVRTFALVLPDGTRHAVTGSIVLGRDPVAPSAFSAASIVVVVDPTKSVSKTHAVVVAAPNGLEVHDLHSTNGVSITRAGVRDELAAGASGQAAAGDRVALGLWELEVVFATV